MNTSLEDLYKSCQSLWSKNKYKKGKKIDKTNQNRKKNGKPPILNTIRLRTKKSQNTARIERKSENTFNYKDKYIKVPRIGFIKMAEPLRWKFEDNIKTVTFKKEAEKYYVSISMETNNYIIYEKTNRSIALDWGVKTFLTGFDGTELIEIDFDKDKIKKFDNNISAKQKRLSNRIRNSKSWYLAKTKLEQAYKRKENYQSNNIFEIANYITKNYDNVVLEDLSISNLMQNHKLARSISNHPFYKLKMILFNKMKQSDKKVLLVPNTFPSTQTCSSCGNVKQDTDKLKLSERIYKCNSCGYEENRDFNAAKNILRYPNKIEFLGY
jgi:putative transposase